MGSKSSKISSDSGTSASEDSTWFLAGDLLQWEEEHGLKFGDSTLFMDGPEFGVKEVEDPPHPALFLPKFTSSKQELREQKLLSSSYDRIPQPAVPSYPHQGSPVRGRARKNLQGWACENCEEYYSAAGLDMEAVNKCSKHRSKYPRTRSPKGYWSLTLD